MSAEEPEKGACVRTPPWSILPFLALLCACSRHGPGRPDTVDPPTLTLSWIRPLDGSTLADSVRIEIDPRNGAIEEIAVGADDSTVVVLIEPPWRAAWLPSGATRRIRLTARAGDVEAPVIDVDWSANEAPRVTIRLPREARGVDLSSGDSLRCEAVDPEDGTLAGGSILWTSDRQGLLGAGAAIPVSCLISGPHRIRVRATDRWLRAGWSEVEIEAFSFGDGTTPEGALEDVRHAWLAADPDRYAERIDPAFRFLFCPIDRERDASMPPWWDLETEVAWFRALAARPGSLDRVEWRIGPVQESTIGGRRLAKAEIDAIQVRLIPAEAETLSIVNGRARVYLRLATDDGMWRIEQWMDNGADGEVSQGALRMAVAVSGQGVRGSWVGGGPRQARAAMSLLKAWNLASYASKAGRPGMEAWERDVTNLSRSRYTIDPDAG
jgi:hypothetical protein